MRPVYVVTLGGTDITGNIADRLISLSISDEAGVSSDRFELALDDRDHALGWPGAGVELEIALGYRETGGARTMGRYTVDEVESSGPPAVLNLRGAAADMLASLKSQRRADYDGQTVGEIVRTIAGRHGLTPRVAAVFESQPVEHLDQTDESDLHLLTRLADQFGAVAKPGGGRLLFVEQGKGLDATGAAMPAVAIARDQVLSWRASEQERQFYQRVQARWKPARKHATQTVEVGNGEPSTTLRNAFRSETEAKRAAEARLRKMARSRTALSLSLPGDPDLVAERPIALAGFRAGVDGAWIITRAEHRIDSSGYVASIEAQRTDGVGE
ncbi:MAG: contractile injection system protein, VgrG/Pvc8 family [Xanthomonadaceae bacterium]|nr:contractile injection system protein, VgrG/Pvc8 family [Xanthomonadaceae bacterium]